MSEIVAETLHELIDPIIYDEAATLIEEHHLAGRDVVIVSSSGAEVVEPIGEMLGADHVIATRMVVEDGRYTGEIEYYAYGENKATAIRELAEREGYDLARCYAYSDSVTDLPMLEAVGHPYAVNPDRALRKEARRRDWPVLVFTRPVRLRDRLRRCQPAAAEHAGGSRGRSRRGDGRPGVARRAARGAARRGCRVSVGRHAARPAAEVKKARGSSLGTGRCVRPEGEARQLGTHAATCPCTGRRARLVLVSRHTVHAW